MIDLARYPLDQPTSDVWVGLVERCRADLERTGMFNLEGLLSPDDAGRCVATLGPRFQSESFHQTRDHNIYFSDPIAELPADHPVQRHSVTDNFTLCAYQVTDTVLTKLYEWPPLRHFIAACMQMPELHPMDDPLARLNVMAYRDGQALGWHFDRSEFTTTLLLQAPVGGGVFEYRTDLRSADDENHDGVGELLLGNDSAVQSLVLEPGTLNVFRGKNTAHRVTAVDGQRDRVIAVFSYFDRPGVVLTGEERRGFYGRDSD